MFQVVILESSICCIPYCMHLKVFSISQTIFETATFPPTKCPSIVTFDKPRVYFVVLLSFIPIILDFTIGPPQRFFKGVGLRNSFVSSTCFYIQAISDVPTF